MDIRDLLSKCDHTLLANDMTREQLYRLIDEGIEYGTATVCIPPSYVALADEYSGGRIKICTVIGFPLGYSTKAAKVYETIDAIENGADEIDMVINVSYLKDCRDAELTEEIAAVKNVCGDKTLKVIIETCLLTDEEKIRACKIVTDGGADFIKTSTGFSSGGATAKDIKLLSDNIGEGVRVKAAGGISSISDAEELIACGACRLGTSRLVKLAKSEAGEGY